jgi:hypothetical protein
MFIARPIEASKKFLGTPMRSFTLSGRGPSLLPQIRGKKRFKAPHQKLISNSPYTH